MIDRDPSMLDVAKNNKYKLVLVLSILIFTVITKADAEISRCLDAYGKVWDIKQWKCVKASLGDLPYSKRERR
ncbi:MAG: hypothetical protein HF962_00550 [Sulfurovum sp.]|nr:hypothetical protein [Sulfurovum sp.]